MNDYAGYQDWKGWGGAGFMNPDRWERAYFDREIGGSIARGEVLLEIGFGDGKLLAWAHERGIETYGTELSETALAAASARGVNVLPADWTAWPELLDGRVAMVVALDVLEHLTYVDIRSLFQRVGRLLRPGGKFIARFPNGQSPLGRVHQHGDLTHLTTLSGPVVDQLARDTSLVAVCYRDPVRIHQGTLPLRAIKRGRDAIRRLVEFAVKRLFVFDVPLDFDTIAVLERRVPSLSNPPPAG